MAEWHLFPFAAERKDDYLVDKTDRRAVERAVAFNVAYLLSHYGEVSSEDDIDIGPIDLEQLKTYTTIGFGTHVLEDDSELTVEQLPFTPDGVITEPGVHWVSHDGDDAQFLNGFVVYDPELRSENWVTTTSGTQVPMTTLSELADATFTLILACEAEDIEVNRPLLNTTAYPQPFIEYDLLALAEELGGLDG